MDNLSLEKRKNIVENVIEGNFQRAEDQLFNILVRKAKKTLKKSLKERL